MDRKRAFRGRTGRLQCALRGESVVREIEDHRVALEALCRGFRVRRLELFGSAVGEAFVQESSDLDFIVEFDDLPANGYADAYFGLAEALRELFHRDVDLVVLSAVKNPFFRESIERSRTLLYAA
jgi:hypothetical protein